MAENEEQAPFEIAYPGSDEPLKFESLKHLQEVLQREEHILQQLISVRPDAQGYKDQAGQLAQTLRSLIDQEKTELNESLSNKLPNFFHEIYERIPRFDSEQRNFARILRELGGTETELGAVYYFSKPAKFSQSSLKSREAGAILAAVLFDEQLPRHSRSTCGMLE